jgi:ABC-type uncharacterized transport system permease subunit
MIQIPIPIIALEAGVLVALIVAFISNAITRDQLILGVIFWSAISSLIILTIVRKPKP